jgi:protein-tyrosine-phosphatase/DNA-binding transcriptional ArsR family regulator
VPSTVDRSTGDVLRLIGDPIRWALLRHLRDSDLRVGDLVALTGRAQNVVSYHLGALRDKDLVSGRRSSADGRDTYYRVHIDRVAQLLGDVASTLDPSLRIAVAERGPIASRTRRPRVLFLCTGNSARSQIAEALTIHRSGGAVDARSAGSHPKVLHPNAVRVLAERGIDISSATTKHLDTMRRTRFDRIVTLCDRVKEICPELPGAPIATHWSMADPAASADTDAGTYPAFATTADDIELRVGRLLADLGNEQEASHAHR